jgi:hypothetical protein
MFMPARSLKFDTDFLALVITGRCRVMVASSFAGLLEHLAVVLGLADAHVDHDLLDARHGHRVG